MKSVPKKLTCFIVLISIILTTGCNETVNQENTPPAQEDSSSEPKSQEKYISLPEKMGVNESLIMFNQTETGQPLIYTIGQEEMKYYYTKYIFENNEWISEKAEFQDAVNKENSKMPVQRVFIRGNFLYLVNAIILNKEKNQYDLLLYQYDLKKDKLKKLKFDQLTYTDESTGASYSIFDMQFIDDENFVAAYQSGKLICYNLPENTIKEYNGQIYGNFKVFQDEIFTGDSAKKNIIGIDLPSLNASDEITLDLQTNGYNFCAFGDELYVGCKNGIFSLSGSEAKKIIDGTCFSTYAINDNSQIVALCRDNDQFYVLFSEGNSYKFYAYPVVEGV